MLYGTIKNCACNDKLCISKKVKFKYFPKNAIFVVYVCYPDHHVHNIYPLLTFLVKRKIIYST